MHQLILHLLGDYLFQNDWIATNKTKNTFKGWIACLIHIILYSTPFLLIGSVNAVICIAITHFLIDKFRIETYIIKLKNWNWKSERGFNESVPDNVKFFVSTLNDNSLHLLINYISLLIL